MRFNHLPFVVKQLSIPALYVSESSHGDYVSVVRQILLALYSIRYHRGNDASVWSIICKNEYRKCAVIECYESLKHVVRKVLRDDSEEYEIFIIIFEEIDQAIKLKRFTSSFLLPEMMDVHARVVDLVSLLLTRPTQKQLQKVRCLGV